MNNRQKYFNNRWQFRVFLLLPTVVFYMLLYALSDSINIDFKFNELLASAVIGNFGITITAVSIFAVFEKSGDLLKAKSKVWFIDAIILALLDLIFSLIFSINNKQALIFIVLLSCYHTYMIFHYYLRERFIRERFKPTETKDNETKDDDEYQKNRFPFLTILDAVALFVPAILFLHFDFCFSGNSTIQAIIFYVLFSIYVLGCIAVKEFYIEEKYKNCKRKKN